MMRIGLKVPPAEIEFRGLFKVRLLLGDDGRKRVILAELAEALGLQARGLQQRASRAFLKGTCIMHAPSAGGMQAAIVLDLRYLPGLLAGIEVSRVRREIRDRLEEIQDELYDALAAYTSRAVARASMAWTWRRNRTGMEGPTTAADAWASVGWATSLVASPYNKELSRASSRSSRAGPRSR